MTDIACDQCNGTGVQDGCFCDEFTPGDTPEQHQREVHKCPAKHIVLTRDGETIHADPSKVQWRCVLEADAPSHTWHKCYDRCGWYPRPVGAPWKEATA